jgi:hypothetical protein
VRVARAHETLDERRQVVTELLDFIHDFNQLDTTSLVQRVLSEQAFLEAAEAVLLSAVGPWKSVEALRDFCVQNLIGISAPTLGLADRIRPHARMTPFSVPFALLRAMAPNPGQFEVHRLRSLSVADAIDLHGPGVDDRWQTMVPRDEAWLVTTMWARAIPRCAPKVHDIEVWDQGANRMLHRGKLWALTADAMPCFWWLAPVTPIEVRITRQREDEQATLMLVVEGWRYITR